MADRIWTVGYGGVDFGAFTATLRDAGIRLVVDCRAIPFSRSCPAYSLQALAQGLAAADVGYIHDEELANVVMEECRAADSLDPYQQHLAAHPRALDGVLSIIEAGQRAVLLCGCPRADLCHRDVIARALQERVPGLKVEHLRPPQGEREGPAPRILGLSLIQPWAFSICLLGKRVENRTWKPWCPIGTYLAIHAGKKTDWEAVNDLRREGLAVPDRMPLGQIVGVARLADVIDRQIDGPPPGQEMWFSGPWGWVLDHVVPIQPVPCKGRQGLWRLPEEVLAEVRVLWKVARELGRGVA